MMLFFPWNEDILSALLFGSVSQANIATVVFNCSKNIDEALDLVRFVESSLPSNVDFLGTLSLVGVICPFDLNSLATFMNTKHFLLLFADVSSLKLRDIDAIIKLNKEINLRPLGEKSNDGYVIQTSLQLNVNINMSKKRIINKEITSALSTKLVDIESLCFIPPDKSFILGRTKLVDRKQFNKRMLEMSECLFGGKKIVSFTPVIPISKDFDVSSSKLSPIVKIRKDLAVFCNLKVLLCSVTGVELSNSPVEILLSLRKALKRTVYLVDRCLHEFIDSNSKVLQKLVNISCGIFSTSIGLLSLVYPRIDNEVMLRNYRAKLHRIFNLPTNKPMLRPSLSLQFRHRNSKMLESPHLHIKSYKSKGDISLVSGSYNYYHYMQDGLNDSGWGCAYRSLQTIWSWFILQGYIDKPVPTHVDIQQVLVIFLRILYECGDKDANFVGSHQWIGSVELAYCLENMAGIESRMLTTNSGRDVVANIRQLAHHFKIYGTPVMIGGGMLAHTILGVDFNESTGQSSFLVLDPHYCGDEDLQAVISKGWCGWKMPSFWKEECFYNLLLPIPPQDIF
ncbi:unnamed protein product [Thelazia callipaeda]|uniref:Ufm1-specific protease n=1 Tax=Thelazia callipaeda TaxID=103827 RepID=A0A0N5CUT0_THECL|nr:unnamed protein product [Thelazia callipaeda]